MFAPVSVIITNFNRESYISQAIRSVHAQTYKGPVELIVVDDASTDGGVAIIERFKNVRLIRNPENKGVLLSTLAGIEAASHDLLFFLDGDDVWKEDKLDCILPLFDDAGVTLVTHDVEYMDEKGRRVSRTSIVEQQMKLVQPECWGASVIEGILGLGTYVWLGSAYAVHRGRGRVDEFIVWAQQLPDPRRTYQDWPLAYWVASLPEARASYAPHKLFRYRLHETNYSGDASTPERMKRNLLQARNTSQAMLLLARHRALPAKYCRKVERRIALNEYQLDLLDGRWSRAVLALWALRDELRQRGILAKELLRLLGFWLIGAGPFLALAKRQKLLRNLRPS